MTLKSNSPGLCDIHYVFFLQWSLLREHVKGNMMQTDDTVV